MFNAEEYTISVRQEHIDGEAYWVARVEELSDILEFGETREEAYALAIDTISVAQEMCLSQGTVFPSPKIFTEPDVSGRVTLRLPKSVHASCIKNAESEGVSLNTYLLTCIASYKPGQSSSYLDVSPEKNIWKTPSIEQMYAAFQHSIHHIKRHEFSVAIETQGSLNKVSFRDPLTELPLSCGEIAASFNKAKFQNA